MDWYMGNGMDDLVVPNDGGSDRLPSPDSWSKWGVSASEGFQYPNKGYSMYPQFDKEVDFSGKGFRDECEMGTSANDRDQSSSSSVCEGLSEDSLQKTSLSYNRNYNQLEDLQQMDDIFLSSLLDDLPEAESGHISFFYQSDSSGMLAADSISTSMNLDSQSISSGVYSAGSSKYLNTPAFSSELDSEKGNITISQFSPCISEQNDCSTKKAQTLKSIPPSEQGCMHAGVDDETSVEQSILQDLEMVITQLSEKTRICFRDALYRLADNSKGNHVEHSQEEDLPTDEPSSWAEHNDTIRSGSKKGAESETNTIDRAIASLMFNEIGFNAQDLSGGSSSDSKHEFNGASGQQLSDSSYRRPQVSYSHQNSVFPHDGEGATLSQGDVHRKMTSNPGGKRKSPMSEYGSAAEF